MLHINARTAKRRIGGANAPQVDTIDIFDDRDSTIIVFNIETSSKVAFSFSGIDNYEGSGDEAHSYHQACAGAIPPSAILMESDVSCHSVSDCVTIDRVPNSNTLRCTIPFGATLKLVVLSKEVIRLFVNEQLVEPEE